jgi:mannosyltransferase OCH1-like enzyme
MQIKIDKSEAIPKIIHQIWLGPLEPPTEVMQTWKELHPEWEYLLWSENNLPQLKNQQAFDKSKAFTQKADILRYELLYHYGGIFVDADEHCIKPIDSLFEKIRQNNCDCFAVYERGSSGLIANGIMGCTAKNAFMEKMTDEIDIDEKGDPWELVGPKYLTAMMEKYQPAAHIFPSKVFLPIHFRDKDQRNIDIEELKKDPEIYGIQLWGTTTSAYRPKFLTSPILFLRYLLKKLRKKTFVIS